LIISRVVVTLARILTVTVGPHGLAFAGEISL
jgi:hypothetical protein